MIKFKKFRVAHWPGRSLKTMEDLQLNVWANAVCSAELQNN